MAKKLTSGSLKGGKSQPSSKAKAGEGGRFKALKSKLSGQKGVKDPGALAAAIGRAKFGKKKFQGMAKRGFYEGFTQVLYEAGFPLTAIPEAVNSIEKAAFADWS